MTASYAIDVDPTRDLVRIKMSGFFTPEQLTAFLTARAVAHRQLTCKRNHHVTINDVRDMKIQSQDMVSAFRDLLAAPDYRSRKLAFVVGPTLARSQLLRALDARQARCFDNSAQAEAWVLE